MEFDTSAAAEAIRNAVASENQTDQAPQTEQTPQDVQGTTQDDSLFKNIDPESLSPEMKSLYDSMHGDYTRKTQELADTRREYEALGGLDQARGAIDFVRALQDPNNLVQLHSELSDYLQQIGYTREEAQQAATQELTSTDYDNEISDPTQDALRRELDEVRTFREEIQQERLQNEIESALARQENIIRQTNPTYTDDDIHSIYRAAYAFGGDLLAAQNAFEGERQRIISSYANAKSTIPSGLSSPLSSAPGAETPDKFNTLEEAHAYAKQRAAAIANMGGFDN